MTRDHARYLLVETIIGALFGAAFGALFCFLFFGGTAQIPARALVTDAAPQSFMTALFAALFPTLLTRKRLRRGQVKSAPGGVAGLPRSDILRVLLIALATTVAGVALWAASLAIGPAHLPFVPVLAAKTVFGVLVGGGVAAAATRLALSNPPVQGEAVSRSKS